MLERRGLWGRVPCRLLPFWWVDPLCRVGGAAEVAIEDVVVRRSSQQVQSEVKGNGPRLYDSRQNGESYWLDACTISRLGRHSNLYTCCRTGRCGAAQSAADRRTLSYSGDEDVQNKQSAGCEKRKAVVEEQMRKGRGTRTGLY